MILKREDVIKVLDILEQVYPEADCALHFDNVFQLLIAVVLSAQTTDKSVNRVTPELFTRYPDAFALSKASETDVEAIIHTIGMYRTKAKHVVALSGILAEQYEGIVPGDYDLLVKLPGVGRKTANVVLAFGFGQQRIPVDTHVFRVSNRIGIVEEKDVLKTELALMEQIPEARWSRSHHLLIFHGRNCCDARKPACETCRIAAYCQYRNANGKG